MRQRYKLRVEVVPGLSREECFILIPTRTGKACVAVAPGSITPDQCIEVWPSRQEESWVFVNIPSLEKRTPQVWVPVESVQVEEPGSGGAADGAWPGAPQTGAGPREAPISQERAHRRLSVPSLVVEAPGAIRDISLGGISLDRVPARRVGERCRLKLTDIFQDECCEMDAEVVWFRHGRIGLRWVSLTCAQERWLQQRMGQDTNSRAYRRPSPKQPESPARVPQAPAVRLTVAFQPPSALVSSLY